MTVYLILMCCLSGFSQRVNLLPDTIQLCAGDTASIEVRHDLGSQQVIRWNTPSGRIDGKLRIKAYMQGMYYITAGSSGGVISNRDSTFLKVLRRPVHVLKDTVLCAGSSINLDAANPGMSYAWSTGDRSRTITVDSEGAYRVRISNGRCFVNDTSRVRVIGSAEPFRQQEITFCLGDPLRMLSVKAPSESRIEWNTGATSHSISVPKAGTYSVRILHPSCPEVRDTVRVTMKACECEIMVPNSFTPNEDNRNDYFFPVLSCEYSYYNLTITDRWGNEVFVSGNPSGRWDGRFKGNLCPEDIYVYKIEATEKLTDKKIARRGHISLFR